MPLWMDWVDYVRARPDQPIDLEYERDGQLYAGDYGAAADHAGRR